MGKRKQPKITKESNSAFGTYPDEQRYVYHLATETLLSPISKKGCFDEDKNARMTTIGNVMDKSSGRGKGSQLEEDSEFEKLPHIAKTSSGMKDLSKSKGSTGAVVRQYPPSQIHQHRSLQNTGNSCYLNSVTQALAACLAFSRRCELIRVMRHSTLESSQSPVNRDTRREYVVYTLFTSILSSLLNKEATESIPSKTLLAFRYAIGKLNKDFANDKQHDAHDFLLTVLNAVDTLFIRNQNLGNLEQSAKIVNPYDVFKFKCEKKSVCELCNDVTLMEAENNTFFLPVGKNRTVEELFHSIFEWCPVERKCSNCEHEHSSSSERISKFPTSLILALKIFENKGRVCTKKSQIIEASFEIDVAPLGIYKELKHTESNTSQGHYEPTISVDPASKTQSLPELSIIEVDVVPQPAKLYHLVAAVCHIGEGLDNGHYVSYVKDLYHEDVWIQCDDSTIEQVDKKTVSAAISLNGYIYFYSRKGL